MGRAKAAVIKDELKIEYVPLDQVQKWPRNPKNHDLDTLEKSISRFGFVQPVIVDGESNRLVAGHGRLEALLRMRQAGGNPPKRVLVDKASGAWLIPVLSGVKFASEADAEAYLIADNRIVELGGWDTNLLTDMLQELTSDSFKLEGVGFDLKMIEDMIETQRRETIGDEVVEDGDAPALPITPVTKIGDLWKLGDHVLCCGDCTDSSVVDRLMKGRKAILMATDPPYGVAYHAENRSFSVSDRKSIPKWDEIENDEKTGENIQPFLEGAFCVAATVALDLHAAWYLWHAQLTQGFFAAAAAAANLLLHRQIIWVKPSLLLGHGDYHWRHELCFYGWVQGNRPPFYGGRSQSTVWEITHDTSSINRIHPTQKPLELFAIPIRNHTRPGEICYEPFGGSGSCLIAAEQLGRSCLCVEISPAYCDVIVERWQNLTGKKAKRIK